MQMVMRSNLSLCNIFFRNLYSTLYLLTYRNASIKNFRFLLQQLKELLNIAIFFTFFTDVGFISGALFYYFIFNVLFAVIRFRFKVFEIAGIVCITLFSLKC